MDTEKDLFNQLNEFFAEEDSHIPVYGAPKPGIAATEEEAKLEAFANAPKFDSDVSISGGGNDPLLTPERECRIVQDLLPLYEDDSCSLYTKDFVNRHLAHCSECKYILANMQTDMGISVITDPEGDLRRLKKSMFKKQYSTIALLTLFFTAVLCAVAFSFIASTVRGEVAGEYEAMYYEAVDEYKRELEEGNLIDRVEEKIWEKIEESRANAENEIR